MNTSSSNILALTSAVMLCCGSMLAQHQTQQDRNAAIKTKEVLLSQDGKERHWVIRSGQLITEEHYLTAHGDLHFVVEYPKGVRKPQVDSKDRKENVQSVVKGFWRNGKSMSVTPMSGEKANGRDVAYWPSGKTAREALFVMGVPTGTWKFYDVSGKPVGEGVFENGKRWSGVFVGKEKPGANFLLTGYPVKKVTFEGGMLKHETDFLQEDFLEKYFSNEMRSQ